MAETPPKAPEVKELSKLDRLTSLFNKAVDAIKKSADARKAVDPSKDLVDMDEKAKEQFEAPKVSWEKAFDLGKFEINQEEVKKLPEITDDKVYLLLGSVDRVPFQKHYKRENLEVDRYGDGTKTKWYEAIKEDAALFIKLKDGIETNFPQLADTAKKDRMVQIVTDISQMTDFTDAAWRTMFKDKGYTDAEIYGAEGAYNLLLSFQRAIAPIDREELGKDEDVVIGQNEKEEDIKAGKYTIRLEVASKKGKSDGDRFSKLVEVKVKEEEEEQEEEKPTPEPPAPTPEPEPVKPPPAEIPSDSSNNYDLDLRARLAESGGYDYVNGFSEGLAWVKKGDKWGFIDKNGKEYFGHNLSTDKK